MSAELAVLLAVFLPLAAVPAIAALGARPNLREAATIGTAAVTFLAAASLFPEVAAGGRPGLALVEVLPGLDIAFAVEPLGLLFGAVASFLWIVTSVYSIGYMRGHGERNQTRFYACFAVAIGAALGVAFAANMFTLFAFYEALTLSTYPLVTHHGTEEAKRAGRLYLGLLLGTSLGFQLLAIVWTWIAAGTLDFTPGGILQGKVDGPLAGVLLAFYVFGIGKAALMPFHRWLPAAMVAPVPVSALLHAVAVVKAGVFTVLKVVLYLFGLDLVSAVAMGPWLGYAAAATMVIASLVALAKDNLKARLAYSTVSQLAYVVLGAALGSGLGVLGGALHLAMHAFGKITLFFCAGTIMVAAHKTEVSEMAGLGRAMPLTFVAFFVASLSLIGLPPLGGMWSKWYLALASAEAHQSILLALLMLSSLLNVGYLVPVAVRGFFPPRSPQGREGVPAGDPRVGTAALREAPASCLIAQGVTAAGCLALFFLADRIVDFLAPIAGR